ncbi:MAG: PilC/PilY family type IV pilus protein [Thiobacillaceae bacterium]|nr:PilC/PilY family type IV pilus protein [Thiobacillaceae bacterium]
MSKRHDTRHQRGLGWGWLAVCGLLTIMPVRALDLATTPQSVPAPLAPNVILTLDDSTTMAYAYPSDRNYSASTGSYRYDFAAHYNPLYYDPAITYAPPPGYANSNFAAACLNGYSCTRTLDLSTRYRPTASYGPRQDRNSFMVHPKIDVSAPNGTCIADCKFDTAFQEGPAYYYRHDPNNAGCDGQKTTQACYTYRRITDDGAAAQQNFANWYSYYRTRNLAAVTALMHVLPGMDGKIRLAWQGVSAPSDVPGCFDNCIADCDLRGGTADEVQACKDTCAGGCGEYFCKDLTGNNCWGWDQSRYDNRLKPFSGAHKASFLNWLTRVGTGPVNSAMRSAMMRAGDYFSTTAAYRQNPLDAQSTAYSCRDNFHIMVSDGQWKTPDVVTINALPLACGGRVDDCTVALPTPASAATFNPGSYTPRAPYQDANIRSLADLAMHYWVNDLVNTLDNNVFGNTPDKTGAPADRFWNPRNDPASWQHMVNYVIGSGMTTALGADWTGDTYSGPQARGDKPWPGIDTAAGRVYDYWHMAISSRGQFFPVDKANEVVEALTNVFNRIEERKSSAAALAANSTRLDTGTAIFQATFYTGDWHGELTATEVKADGTLGNLLWTASIPEHGSRNLFTWNGADGSAFTWDGLSAAQKIAIDDDIDDATPNAQDGQVDNAAEAQAVLAYLRGDRSQEQRVVGGATLGKYRTRGALLGDIVNSDPVYVSATDYGYSRLPEGADTAAKPYKTFLNANKARTKMLYVGANDGMLHAFRADTGQADSGQERFAYVPDAVIPELARLSNPGYAHRYYVDGAPYAGDAYLDLNGAGKAWKTILLGTTGAGGRAVFALDVTDPDNFDADKVMWEFSAADDADLGYSIGLPVIARLNNGKWAAVFGNGYNSAQGHGVLFVVDLETGGVIKKFDVNQGQGNLDNGLAAPALYDANGDGVTDYVYAGDNEGNIWKFRLTDELGPNDPNYNPADTAKWAVAYNQQPLFVARNANDQSQSISAPLELGGPPPGLSGVMVYFGTGRFVATGDKVDKTVQTLYGVLDSGSAIAETNRSTLQQQSIVYEGTLGSRRVRATGNNAVDYSSKRGWFMDLLYGNAAGERVVSIPLLRHGRVVFTTMIPSDDPCKAGGDSWIMEFVATTGGANEAVFDVDGVAGWDYIEYQVGDTTVRVPVSGVQTDVGIIKGIAVVTGAVGEEYKLGSGSEEAKVEAIKEKAGTGATGRVSWREIID